MNKLNKISKKVVGLIASTIFFAAFFGGTALKAQPTNYCDPTNPTGFTAPIYYTCYPAYYEGMGWYTAYYGARITEVNIKTLSGAGVFSNVTPPTSYCNPQGYKYYSEAGITSLDIGDTYTFEIKVAFTYYNYYCYSNYYTMRLFIDWNADGDWVDAGEWVNSPSGLNQTPSWRSYYSAWGPSCGSLTTFSYNVKVPDNVDAQKVRMRVMAAYYYPYQIDQVSDYGWAKFYNQAINPCLNGYAYDYYTYGYSYVYSYGETEDYALEFQLPLKGVFPSNEAPNDILLAGELYNGTTRTLTDENGDPYDVWFENPYIEFKTTQPAGTYIKYEIKGALPSTNSVYKGLDKITGSELINASTSAKIKSEKATGSSAPGGNGALKVNSGGEYQVWITIVKPNGQEKLIIKNFTVSWLNDLSVSNILSPRTNAYPIFYKYPPEVPVPITAIFQNVGLKNITKFNAIAKIYGSDGTLKWTRTIVFDTNKVEYDVLSPKEKITITFPTYITDVLDEYKLVVEAELLSANDMEAFNDLFPRPEEPNYVFQIQAETEIGALSIINPVPNSTIYAGKAFRPAGMIINYGVGDVSNIAGTFVIKKMPGGTIVKTFTTTIPDVPSGLYNKRIAEFDGYILGEPGTYECTFTVMANGDFVSTNNSVTSTFTVIGGLKDIVQVGNGKDFNSLVEFNSALYERGLGGNLAVELTDSEYNLYSPGPNAPAWDLSSWIVGLGYDEASNSTRKMIFKPSAQKATQRGSITIHLWSQSGKGIFIGQNRNPSNPEAPIYTAPTYAIMKKFINSPGFIEFDGGANKSIKVVFHSTTNNQGQAFFLGRGAHDVRIENIIIENATPSIADKIELPRMKWTPSEGFKYTLDSIPTADKVYGFSAGIANRGTLTNDLFESTQLFIDTVKNSNHKFINNEISGFGYGIASMGIGPLVNPRTLKYEKFYNQNNLIKDNLIFDVERSGVFLGNEDGAQLIGNRIYNVKSTNTEDSYGIELGAYPSSYGFGYNNVNVSFDGNEISNLADSREVAGVRILQNVQKYPSPLGGFLDFPDVADNFTFTNNIIWGVKNTATTGSRYGIAIYNDRNANVFTPKNPGSFGTDLFIANNTIVIPDDQINNLGNQAGIGIMHFNNVKVFNNAIAITDNGIDNSVSQFDAAIAYEGSFPSANSIQSDNNAFWLGNNQNLSHFRLYEIDGSSNVLEPGYNNEFKSLLQWQMYTENDMNSISGWNFTNDFTTNVDLPQYLRVKKFPAPIGSVLHNRGMRLLDDVAEDIDGKLRGEGGYPFDIGAVEFDGRMYLRDLEPLFIVAPGNYRQTAPRTYSEAEYVMTTNPVEVTTRFFNPGSMLAVEIPMEITIEVEGPSGSYEPFLVSTAKMQNIQPSEFSDLNFDLADGLGEDFNPKTYYEFEKDGKNYNVPAHFLPMKENVTPVYKITVKAENDLNNLNNTTTKYVRFYIQKSGFEMMVNAPSDLSVMPATPNVNDIALRMNHDALIEGLSTIGFEKDPASDRFDFDFFNRSGWESRAVDYTMYRTMFWSEGDNEVLPEYLDRYHLFAIDAYLNNVNSDEKKNLIAASQEYVRATKGSDFATLLSNYFRVSDKNPSNPMDVNGNYDGLKIKGISIARNTVETVKATKFAGDGFPKPGYFSIAPSNEGLTQTAYIYETLGEFAPADAPESQRIMGTATTTFKYNSIYFGIDWRHFYNLSDVMRGILDFSEQYDGNILPVNLLSFDAIQTGTRVDLNWATASEFNSSHFEVEKANVNNNSIGTFTKISEVASKGNSGSTVHYGPVSDNNVAFGNTYAYRLKMVDKDGAYSYSDNEMITVQGLEGNLWLGEINPRPASNFATVQVNISTPMNVEITLIDINGRKVMEVMNGTMNASKEFTMNLQSVPSGNYTLILRSGDITLTRTLTVTK